MAGRFELKQAKDSQYMFNLKAGNGQIILTSELYKTKVAAENGIESVRKNAPDDGRYERTENKNGEPYFKLKAANGQEIGRSEYYSSKAAMENGIESVRKNAPNDDRYERTENKNCEPFFKLKAANGQEIGRSEYYSSKAAMENGIESVKKNAPEAEVVEKQA